MRKSQLYRKTAKFMASSFQTAPDMPEETVESTLDALWFQAMGTSLVVEAAVQQPLPELNQKQKELLEQLIEKRASGIPLAHLTGMQQFMGIDFEVSAQALVPRKETELLGFAALGIIKNMAKEKGPVLVVDICTGAGNLGIAFSFHEPKASVFGSDLSTEALKLASQNARKLKLDHRINFWHGDLLEPFRSEEFLGKVDVLTCNPPYISSGKLESLSKGKLSHEPGMAFDGGPFGISILARLIKEAPDFIRSGGWLAFEVGAGQGSGVQRMLLKNPRYGDVQFVTDREDQIRSILAQIA